jgi:heme A synthase
MNRLRVLAIATLAMNIVVILLGALVRSTGSGAGCGRSWPTCNGTIVPVLEGATAIEFAHRATSGIALLMVAVMAWLVFRRTQHGHPARFGAVISGISIIIEALIGAVIVLAEWVANDASLARIVAVPVHLVSTFVLLAGLVLTVFWLGGGKRVLFGQQPRLARPWLLIAFGMLLIGATGGVTALADTLFPKESFVVLGLFDTATTEHFLTRLRVVHPIVAILVGLVALRWTLNNAWSLPGATGRAARFVAGFVIAQFLLGAANVLLLTPTWLALLHLGIADGLWIAWVWIGAEMFQATDP